MFDVRRLADALTPFRFFLAVEDKTGAWFIRANVSNRLFEVIDVHAGKQRGGKWGDIACAGVSIALTPGRFTSPKGMGETECLSDWSPTKATGQAVAWERSILDSGPRMLDELVRSRGGELLARTADARAAVDKYLSLLDRRKTIAELIATLSDGASQAELLEAHRLSRTEGLICLPERSCYDLASIVIARLAADVESDPKRFRGKSPMAVPELTWRFQLFASRLYPERGWKLLGTKRRRQGMSFRLGLH